jgi:cyclic pyranopterin phosphate synthase
MPSHALKTDVTLAILCGGLASRLGEDKGLFKPLGDESLVERSLRLLAPAFGEVLLVVRDEEQAELYRKNLPQLPTHVRLVIDSPSIGKGPAALIGILNGVRAATNDRVVVMAIDQVALRKETLFALVDAPSSRAATLFSQGSSDIHPLPALVRKDAATALQIMADSGSLRLYSSFAELNPTRVNPSVAQNDELAVNCNTVEHMREYFGSPLHDNYGRRLHYLRFSLIEACNLSCTYCLPDGFPEWYRHKARLRADDIHTILSGFRRAGFRKVRFTGGEPTLHPGILSSISLARKIGYEDIAITTNGILINDLKPWLDAGLTQINISLDTLDDDKFLALTKARGVPKLKKLIDEAAQSGIETKINAVLMRSKNGSKDEIAQFIDWALARRVTLRFIELMETKLNGSFAGSERVLGTEIEPLLRERGLAPVTGRKAVRLAGPATEFQSATHAGKIGLINPMSCNFCGDCNRLRVTARGALRLCLFGDSDQPLNLESPVAVEQSLRAAIGKKPEKHYLEDRNVGNVSTFRTIGG